MLCYPEIYTHKSTILRITMELANLPRSVAPAGRDVEEGGGRRLAEAVLAVAAGPAGADPAAE